MESYKNMTSAVSRTTGTSSNKYFPFKSTSANSKKILDLIKNADSKPD
jgi:hypothetical protein